MHELLKHWTNIEAMINTADFKDKNLSDIFTN